jgi:hypothetical protein
MRAPCTFRMSVSPKPSPHRTSAFQRIRRSNPAEFLHFRGLICELRYDHLLWSVTLSDPPGCLDPFPLCLAFPDSLDGRDSVEYYGSAVPPQHWRPIRLSLRKLWEVPALLV